MKKSFSITESIKFGWHTTRAHSGLAFGMTLTLLCVQIVHSMVMNAYGQTSLGGFLSLLLLILGVVIDIGVVIISLKLVRGKEAAYADIIPSWHITCRYVCVGFLIGCMILVPLLAGFTACAIIFLRGAGAAQTFTAMLAVQSTQSLVALSIIIPTTLVVTFYLLLRYVLATFFVVDGSTVMQAMRGSARATYGHKWHLLGFMFVGFGIYILGVLAILVGLLVAIPVVVLAYAHIYTQLKAHIE